MKAFQYTNLMPIPSLEAVRLSIRISFSEIKGRSNPMENTRMILHRTPVENQMSKKTPINKATIGVRDKDIKASKKIAQILHQEILLLRTIGIRMKGKPNVAIRAPNMFLSSNPQK